jgi:uncharacterized protein (TIGR03437 family)
MVRHRGFSLLFTLIALAVAIGSWPARGQTLSFLHPLSGGPDASLYGVTSGAAVAADASGVYVAGAKGLAKYDSHGNTLWTRAFIAGEDVWGPVADGAGVYVVGRIYNPNFQPFVRRYDADGNELWTLQTDSLVKAAADASGLYVAGVVSGETSTTVYVRKYSASGAEQWTRPFGTPIPGIFDGMTVAVDATGVYVVGGNDSSTTMRKYDLSGNELWSRQVPQFAGAVTADNIGVYLVNGGADFFLHKYDARGNELWARPVGAMAGALAADATGIYILGQTGGGFLPGQCRSGLNGDAFARKYSPDGAELWTRESFDASYNFSSYAWGLAVDDTGVYVVGQGSTDANPNVAESFLAKFEKTAAVVTDSRPSILPGCPVNAASYVGGGVAPGEIVTIFGAAMGPSDLVPLSITGDRLDTTLAGARILFNGAPAPLLYVSDKQSSAIVPYALAGTTSVDVQVEYQDVVSDVVTVPVLPARPGIFSLDGSSQGLLAIVNEDGSVNSPSNPAARGSIVTIYATGGGERDPAVADGQILSDVLPRTSLGVFLWFDNGPQFDVNAAGEVLYAGGSPGSVAGLLQLNVRVPPDALAGKAVAFGLAIGNSRAPGSLTIALR